MLYPTFMLCSATWIIKLLDPGLKGTPGLSNVGLFTFSWDAVNTWHFQAENIFDVLKKTGDIVAYSLRLRLDRKAYFKCLVSKWGHCS